jgi:NADPH:quinone reductase-like Zn-dependent oxidoreductase
VERELEAPPPGSVQVKIKAAGVAFTDLSMRYGMYPGVPPLPYAPGYDIAGEVSAVGEGVGSYKAGDRVAALTVSGGYSEYITLDQGKLVTVPEGIDFAEASTLVLSYVTAYQLLHRIGKVRAGQQILVHGAAGGVGTALVQLGKLASLKVYGTASTGKQDYLRSLGAIPIDYKSEDFVKRILQLSNGVDIVFDNIGAENLKRSQKALSKNGKLISYGFLSSLKDGKANKAVIMKTIMNLILMSLIPNGLDVAFPIYDIKTSVKKHPDWFREDLTKLFRLLKDGKIKPRITKRLPLEKAAEAQELLAKGAVTGKIVLEPN